MTGLEKGIEAAKEVACGFGLSFGQIDFSEVPALVIDQRSVFRNRYQHWSLWAELNRRRFLYEQKELILHEHLDFGTHLTGLLPSDDLPIFQLYQVARYLALADFYQNNAFFKDRKADLNLSFGLRRALVEKYAVDYGAEAVNQCLDTAYALEGFIDPGSKYGPTALDYKRYDRARFKADQAIRRTQMDRVYPYADLDSKEERADREARLQLAKDTLEQEKAPFPSKKEPDLLLFLSVNAPLEDWQKDLLQIHRRNWLDLLPERRTRIIAEGWANLWTVRILREMGGEGMITEREAEYWPNLHGKVVAPKNNRLEWLGLEIFKDIQRRQAGKPLREGTVEKDWLGQPKPALPKLTPDGRSYIFSLREGCDDGGFLQEFLTPDLVEELIKEYGLRIAQGGTILTDLLAVRQAIIDSNRVPLVQVGIGGADYQAKGELYLTHEWDGQPLDPRQTPQMLQMIRDIWGRPVHLETRQNNQRVQFNCVDEGGTLTEILDSKSS